MTASPPLSSRVRKRILVCSTRLTAYVEQDVHMGIRRYAMTQPDWEIGYVSAEEAQDLHPDMLRSWKLDGILFVTRPSRAPLLLENSGVPTVLVDLHHDRPEGLSRVEIDDDGIGGLAADYFLRKRFEHFAVATPPGTAPLPPFANGASTWP